MMTSKPNYNILFTDDFFSYLVAADHLHPKTADGDCSIKDKEKDVSCVLSGRDMADFCAFSRATIKFWKEHQASFTKAWNGLSRDKRRKILQPLFPFSVKDILKKQEELELKGIVPLWSEDDKEGEIQSIPSFSFESALLGGSPKDMPSLRRMKITNVVGLFDTCCDFVDMHEQYRYHSTTAHRSRPTRKLKQPLYKHKAFVSTVDSDDGTLKFGDMFVVRKEATIGKHIEDLYHAFYIRPLNEFYEIFVELLSAYVDLFTTVDATVKWLIGQFTRSGACPTRDAVL
ncbi:hypothetical protein HDV05_000887 [Chytridiales sp. JEL 0842]|nr:hypothetical protein HDV05_000887 [Chytridiales sp. JEL 0842]